MSQDRPKRIRDWYAIELSATDRPAIRRMKVMQKSEGDLVDKELAKSVLVLLEKSEDVPQDVMDKLKEAAGVEVIEKSELDPKVVARLDAFEKALSDKDEKIVELEKSLAERDEKETRRGYFEKCADLKHVGKADELADTLMELHSVKPELAATHLERLQKSNATLAESALLTESGSSHDDPSDPVAKIEAKAAEYMQKCAESGNDVTKAEAVVYVQKTFPELRKEYYARGN